MFEDHLNVLFFAVLIVCVEARRRGDNAHCASLGIVNGEAATAAREVCGDVHALGALTIVGPESVAGDDSCCEKIVGVSWGADEGDRGADGSIDSEFRRWKWFAASIDANDCHICRWICRQHFSDGKNASIRQPHSGDSGIGVVHHVIVRRDDSIGRQDESAAIAQVPAVASITLVAGKNSHRLSDVVFIKSGPVGWLVWHLPHWSGWVR